MHRVSLCALQVIPIFGLFASRVVLLLPALPRPPLELSVEGLEARSRVASQTACQINLLGTPGPRAQTGPSKRGRAAVTARRVGQTVAPNQTLVGFALCCPLVQPARSGFHPPSSATSAPLAWNLAKKELELHHNSHFLNDYSSILRDILAVFVRRAAAAH